MVHRPNRSNQTRTDAVACFHRLHQLRDGATELIGSGFPLTPVGSDDNSGPFNSSKVQFEAVSGTTYRIAVDGFPGELSVGAVKLNWSGPRAPVILKQPVSTNLIAGSTAQFRVEVDGSAPFGFQWRRFGTNLIDDGAHVVGSQTTSLTMGKIFATDTAGYSCVITNAFGAVTSSPANLIVLDNPRVVYVNHVTAPLAGSALLPLHAQAVGDERTYKFSISFDPAVLSNPSVAVGSNTAGANIALNTTLLASGKLGVQSGVAVGVEILIGAEEEWFTMAEPEFEAKEDGADAGHHDGCGRLPGAEDSIEGEGAGQGFDSFRPRIDIEAGCGRAAIEEVEAGLGHAKDAGRNMIALVASRYF